MATADTSLTPRTWTKIADAAEAFTATCSHAFRYSEQDTDVAPADGIQGHFFGPETDHWVLTSDVIRGGYVYVFVPDDVPAVIHVST